MKFPRTLVRVAAIAAALISAASVHADLAPHGFQSATSPHMHLATSHAASDFQVAVPRAGGSCAASSLPRMKAATVSPSSKRLSAAKPSAAGPIEPVEGPDGLKWLCRHDEEEQQCICIPFVQ